MQQPSCLMAREQASAVKDAVTAVDDVSQTAAKPQAALAKLPTLFAVPKKSARPT